MLGLLFRCCPNGAGLGDPVGFGLLRGTFLALFVQPDDQTGGFRPGMSGFTQGWIF